MKKTLLYILLIINISTVFSNQIDGFKTVLSSDNTMINNPVEATQDNDLTTSSRFNPGETTGWFKLNLESERLINYIYVDGYIPFDTTCYVEYEQDGYIKTFPSSFFRNKNGSFIIDLSYDNIVTDSITIQFDGLSLDDLYVNEFSVSSDPVTPQLNKKSFSIGEVSNSVSSYTGAQHLVDGKIGTIWWSFNNENWGNSHWFVREEIDEKHPYKKKDTSWQTSFVELIPDSSEEYEYLQLFIADGANGTIDIEINDQMVENTYVLEDYNEQWIQINLDAYDVIEKVCIYAEGDHHQYTGIGEVELWGFNNPPDNQFLEITPFRNNLENNLSYFLIEELDYHTEYELILVVDSFGDDVLTTEVNGISVDFSKHFNLNGFEYYTYRLTDRNLEKGENFLKSSSNSNFKILNSQIIKSIPRYNLDLTDSSITDHRKYSGVEQNPITLELLDGKADIDKVRIYYTDNQPYDIYLIDEYDQLTYLYPTDTNDTFLDFEVDGVYTQIGITNPNGTTEVQVFGNPIEVKRPFVKVLSPKTSAELETQELGYKVVWGITDYAGGEILIDGFTAKRYGNYFWLSNQKSKFDVPGLYTIETLLKDDSNILADDYFNIIIQSNTNEFTLDQEEKTLFTEEAFYTFSGTYNPWTDHIIINGERLDTDYNTNFTHDVSLVNGLNLVTIELYNSRNGKIKEIHYRKVYKEYLPKSIEILSPTNNSIKNYSSITVTGIVSSRELDYVEVNGVRADLYRNQFKLENISLDKEENTITARAFYLDGESTSSTVTVFSDRTPPELSNIKPEDDSWFSKSIVEISGNVTDDNNVSVFVNKQIAQIVDDTFSINLTLEELENDILIEARDVAGNLTTYPVFNLNIDLTPPEDFTVHSNYDSWTNDKRPILTFNTSDSFSGVNSYKVSINDGVFIEQVSPFQTPFLADGTHNIVVRAFDNVGNYKDSTIKQYIDTKAPDIPTDFRAVASNGAAKLKWIDEDDETYSYVISYGDDQEITVSRFNEENDFINNFEIDVTGLDNDNDYNFEIYAIDRANNISKSVDSSVTVGLTVKELEEDDKTIVEYDNVVLSIPENSLPDDVEEIIASELVSEDLEALAINPIISPIVSFIVRKDDGTVEDHVSFEEDFVGHITYDESLVPEGFPEQNLGVYYYDSNWSRWFLVENSGVDIENNRVYFATNHFTDFSVQPTVFEDVSPQELAAVEFSPFSTKVAHQPVTVSGQGGSASTSMTELSLPGKNGFDFELRRIYDSATAKGDASGLNVNLSLNLADLVGGGPAIAAGVLMKGGLSIANSILNSIDTFFRNNGDYAYSVGQGWRLNLPYIRGANGGVLVRTPSGSFYNMATMQMRVEGSLLGGSFRTVVMENHEGEDFVLKVTQFRNPISASYIANSAMSLATNGELTPPAWALVDAELILKDGSKYYFDSLGRFERSIDPTGLNEINAEYDNLELESITDSMGRVIKFDYVDVGDVTVVPQISKIWIENDEENREVNYTYDNPKEMGVDLGLLDPFKLPLLSDATDINNRFYDYDYDYKFLFAGEVGVKINPVKIALLFVASPKGADAVEIHAGVSTQWVFPLDYVSGPGIGITDINYKTENLTYAEISDGDYFLGLFPTAVDVSIGMEDRLLVSSMKISLDEGPVREETYAYDFEYIEDKQFYNKKFTRDDGKIKEVSTYELFEKIRFTPFDWSDIAADLTSSLFQDESYIKNEKIPLNTKISLYDSVSGARLGDTEKSYYISNLKPKSIKTIKSDENYVEQSFKYDDWGNEIEVITESFAHDRQYKTINYNIYHESDSDSISDFFMDLFLEELGLNWYNDLKANFNASKLNTSISLDVGERHNLKLGSKSIVYDYYNNTQRETEEYYNYDTYGQLNHISKKIGDDDWADTYHTYGYDSTNDLSGELTHTILPNNQEISRTYDFTDAKYYSMTETYLNLTNEISEIPFNISTKNIYERTMGYLIWSTDGRGYTTEHTFDLLGRKTGIVFPDDDEGELNWDPLTTSLNRDNNPKTLIDYNDETLLVTETKASGLITEYQFDNLMRLKTISKLDGENLTTFKYDSWGNITNFINPNKVATTYTYDALGQITSETYVEEGEELSKKTNYFYDDLRKEIIDEKGTKTVQKLDHNNKVLQNKIYDKDGNYVVSTLQYYDSAGNVVASEDGNGHITEFIYNERNLLEKVIHPSAQYYFNAVEVEGRTFTRYEYDKIGNKTFEIQGIDSTDYSSKEYRYDGKSRVTSEIVKVTDVDETTSYSQTKYEYDSNDNLVTTVDPRNFSWFKDYDSRNNLVSETDPLNNITTYQYDSSNRLKEMTDPRENSGHYPGLDFSIIYHYDLLDRLEYAELPATLIDDVLSDKPVIRFTYDQLGNVESRTEPDLGVTTYNYSNKNRLISEIRSGTKNDGTEVSYTTTNKYDAVGNLVEVQMTDINNKIEYEYDSLGRVTKEIYVDGTYKEFVYDQNNNKIREISTNGYKTNYEYDSLNRLTTTIDAEVNTTNTKYDILGNVTKFIDGNNLVYKYLYNEAAQLIAEVNTRNISKTYHYDSAGNLVSDTDFNGSTSTYSVKDNNLLESITYTNQDENKSQSILYNYDEAGAIKSVTDSGITTNYNGYSTSAPENYVPDPYDNKYSVETVGFSEVSYKYDKLNRLINTTYDSGLVIENNYNNLSQLESITNYVTSRSFDINGFLDEVVFDNGVVTDYNYTDKLELAEIDYSYNNSSLKNFLYSYDRGGNIYSENDNLFGYDGKNQLTTAILTGEAAAELYPIETVLLGDAKNDVVGEYQFDLYTEELTSEQLDLDWGAKSLGIDVGYSYMLKTISLHRDSDMGERITKDKIAIYISNYNRDKAYEEATGFTIQTETDKVTITFDSPVFARYIKINSLYNELDNDGNPLYIRSSFRLSKDNPVSVEAITSGRNEFYVLDANGNRTMRTIMSKQVIVDDYVYYENSNLLKKDAKFAYVYDNNGNLIEKGSSYSESIDGLTINKSDIYYSYTYDLKNRLVEVSKYNSEINDTEVVATYLYDSNNYRIQKTDSEGKVTKYIFDIYGNCIEEIYEDTPSVNYVFMNNRHLARVSDGNTLFYGLNNVGSTVLLTDSQGNPVWNGDITPYGDDQETTSNIETVKYTGKTIDEDTGLYYFNARWYDPNLGRFTTEDPIRAGTNWFIYCNNNPLMFIDPTGLDPNNMSLDEADARGWGASPENNTYDLSISSFLSDDQLNKHEYGTPDYYKALSNSIDANQSMLFNAMMDITVDIDLPIFMDSNASTADKEAAMALSKMMNGVEDFKNDVIPKSFQNADFASGMVDLVPGVGGVKNVVEAFSGTDIFSGISYSGMERTFKGIGGAIELAGIGLGIKSYLGSRAPVIPTNGKGLPYPQVNVKGYGNVPFPDGPFTPNNSKILRSQFTPGLKKEFKNWWTNMGRPWPEGNVNIHHIKPLSKGGGNSFDNLVPLIQPEQHQPFTNWWRSFK